MNENDVANVEPAEELAAAPATKPRPAHWPRIIVVGGEKGGTGKTTLAVNLAVELARNGYDALLVDTDPQSSATMWAYYRDAAEVVPRVASVQKQGAGVAHDLRALAQRYEILVVDAGGRDSPELRSAMVVADVLIVPLQASSFDVWTLRKIDEVIAGVRNVRLSADLGDIDARVVINRGSTNPGSKDSDMAADVVADYPGIRLMKAELRDRRSYRATVTNGLGICEGDDEKAKVEMKSFYNEVFPEEVPNEQ